MAEPGEWQEVPPKLTRLNQITQQLTKLNGQVGSGSGDTPHNRAELKRLRDEGQVLVKAVRDILVKPYDRSQKAKHTKLQTQYTELSTAFENIAKATIKTELTRRSSEGSSSSASYQPASSQPSHQPSQGHTVLSPGPQQASLQHDEVDQRLLEERNREMKELEKELVAISEVFVDLDNLTQQQGAQLRVAQSNVESADVRVEEGTKELVKAARYNCAYRKKLVVLILIVTVVVAIIIAVIVVEVRKK